MSESEDHGLILMALRHLREHMLEDDALGAVDQVNDLIHRLSVTRRRVS